MAGANLEESGGGAELVGRHLDCLLPGFSTLVAYGAVALVGWRPGATLLLSALVLCEFLEVPLDDGFVKGFYLTGRLGHTAAVVSQTYADHVTEAQSIRITSPCPPTGVSLRLEVRISPARLNGDPIKVKSFADGWDYYPVSGVSAGTLDMTFTRSAYLDAATTSSNTAVAPVAGGVPAVELYCWVPDPAAYQFRVDYGPAHPFPLTYRELCDWPLAEAWTEALAALTVAVMIGFGAAGSRAEPERLRVP